MLFFADGFVEEALADFAPDVAGLLATFFQAALLQLFGLFQQLAAGLDAGSRGDEQPDAGPHDQS